MYIAREDLRPLCPQKQIDNALDDAGDGTVETILDELIGAAENKVHALLGADYPAPLDEPVPAVVTHCVKVFAVYELWARNGFATDDNPRAGDEKAAREMLAPYASGDRKLYPEPATPVEPEDDNLIAEPNSLDSAYPMV